MGGVRAGRVKILIIISSDTYIRNYITTGSFNEIANHDCYYIAEDKIGSKELLENTNGFSGYYKVDEKTVSDHMELLNILMWRYRHKSKTFYFRFLMLHWPLTAQWYQENKPKNKLRWIFRIIRALKYPILGSSVVSPISIPFYKGKLEINPDILRFIKKIQPHLVIMPCSAYDPIGSDILKLKETNGFKTLFLIDNWDNLSSKSILWRLPDYMGVWGEQSKEHAIQIHGMPPQRVINIGTPRFEEYFFTNRDDHPSPYPFGYILFCGCAEPFDELGALHLLDEELSRNIADIKDIKIVYRPHPARKKRLCPDVFREEEFRKVIMDIQAKEYYYESVSKSYQPNLNYYPALLFNARLTIAPLTSMIIESLACGTKVLAVAYDDKVHFTSPHNVAKYATHLQGIEKLSGLYVCDSKSELGLLMRELITSPSNIERSEIHSSLKYFLFHDSTTYSKRLKNLVDVIEKELVGAL